eukprot:Clim_evm21s157 gene=Clim_evmTU21s157
MANDPSGTEAVEGATEHKPMSAARRRAEARRAKILAQGEQRMAYVTTGKPKQEPQVEQQQPEDTDDQGVPTERKQIEEEERELTANRATAGESTTETATNSGSAIPEPEPRPAVESTDSSASASVIGQRKSRAEKGSSTTMPRRRAGNRRTVEDLERKQAEGLDAGDERAGVMGVVKLLMSQVGMGGDDASKAKSNIPTLTPSSALSGTLSVGLGLVLSLHQINHLSEASEKSTASASYLSAPESLYCHLWRGDHIVAEHSVNAESLSTVFASDRTLTVPIGIGGQSPVLVFTLLMLMIYAMVSGVGFATVLALFSPNSDLMSRAGAGMTLFKPLFGIRRDLGLFLLGLCGPLLMLASSMWHPMLTCHDLDATVGGHVNADDEDFFG